MMNAPLPLLAAQEGIWIGQALEPDSPAFVTAEYVCLRGRVLLAALAEATRRAMEEAEGLRVRVRVAQHVPVQQVCPELSLAPRVIEVADEAAAVAWMTADSGGRFDLLAGPLARHALLVVAGDCIYWYVAIHHLVVDGYAFSLIMQRAAELYSALVQGRPSSPSPFSALVDVVEDDRLYRQGEDMVRDRGFWLSHLDGLPEPASLSRVSPRYASMPRRWLHDLDAATLAALASSPGGRGLSWPHVLTASFAELLAARSGSDEVVLGLPVLARVGSVALRAPTMMMNMLPLRLTARPDACARSRAELVRAELARILPHGRYRHEQLRRELGLRGGQRRLFGPVINIMPFPRQLTFGPLTGTVRGLAMGPVEDLSVSVHPLPGRTGLRLTFDGHPDAYTSDALSELGAEFVALLQGRARDPEGVRTSTPGERVLRGAPLAMPVCDLLDAIRAHARAAGDRIALREGDDATTYHALMMRAQGCARSLQERGVGEGARVALLLPRGRDAVVAMLAVLLCNAAYLPLDPDGPPERSAAILRDARPALLVIEAGAGPLGFATPTLAMPSFEPDSAPAPFPSAATAGPAYVIYTSGTTGVPQGVTVGRSALAHFVAAARARYAFSREDTVLQFAPLGFDASVEEIFVTLAAGATLVVRPPDMTQSAGHFLARAAELSLTVLDLPTAFFHELVYAATFGAALFPASVHTVIIGGEAVLPERVRQFRAATHDRVRLLNTYGPTEATVVALSAELAGENASDSSDDPPIGLPLCGVDAVLRAAGGRDGLYRLYLMGQTLALGYLGNEALTSQRFVDLPGLGRAYHTGDLVRVLPDGQLTFVARSDDQLKISGHRVELREVEATLQTMAGVREVVVVVVRVPGATPRLVAHLVASEAGLAEHDLRAHAQQRLLPAAMPRDFVFHQHLPRTATGKIDRARLRDMPLCRRVDESEGSALEQEVRAVWCEVLGTDGIGLEQDFFELGGQSLQTIQVATRLSVRLGREVTGALLFREPTIRALARALSLPESAQRPDRDVSAQVLEDAQLAPASTRSTARRPQQGASVLLTGATGFLGVHLLNELRRCTERPVVCIVRAHDEHAARARLAAALRAQRLDDALPDRISVLPGDLAKPQLGLESARYDELARSCSAIVHNAASVSLARGYASVRAVNVGATRSLVQLAAEAGGAALHYVSTLATGLGASGDGKVEERFIAYHAGLQDGYSQSKWVSERLLEQAHARGADVRVYRLGRLVGARETACVNREDLVWRMIAAGLRAGVLPVLDVCEPWTPVDLVARAIVRSVLDAAVAGPVFNLAPTSLTALEDVFRWTIAFGYRPTRCDLARFGARLAEATEIEPTTRAMFAGQAQRAVPLISAVETARGDQLADHAGFHWPVLRRADVHRYLATCIADGLIPPPISTETRSPHA